MSIALLSFKQNWLAQAIKIFQNPFHMRMFYSLLLAVTLFLGAITCFQGCQSKPEVVALKVAGTQVLTVDSAMQAWADWVRAGNASQGQVDAVKAAYEKYYVAAQGEHKALAAYVQARSLTNAPPGPEVDYHAAVVALSAAQADLLSLITLIQTTAKGTQP